MRCTTPAPFNPATAVRWEERVDGIDAAMLRGALRLAAHEHIEIGGSVRIAVTAVVAAEPNATTGWPRTTTRSRC